MPLFSGLAILAIAALLIGLLVVGFIKRSRVLVVVIVAVGAALIALSLWSARARDFGSFSCQGTKFTLYAATGLDEVDVTVRIQSPSSEPLSHQLLFWPSAGLPTTKFEARYSTQKQAIWFIADVPSMSMKGVVGSFDFRTSRFEMFALSSSSSHLDLVPPEATVVAEIRSD